MQSAFTHFVMNDLIFHKNSQEPYNDYIFRSLSVFHSDFKQENPENKGLPGKQRDGL